MTRSRSKSERSDDRRYRGRGIGRGALEVGIQVVANVSVADVVKHGVENSVITVHSSKGAAEVVPLVAAVVRQSGVRVLKLSYEDEPEVDDEVGHTINAHHA